MGSQQNDIPAIESGSSSGFFGAISSPIGMIQRNKSYEDNLYAHIQSPTEDFTSTLLWKDSVLNKNRFPNTAEGSNTGGDYLTFEAAKPSKFAVSLVKAKSTSILSSFMSKQIQDSLPRFENQTELSNAVFASNKGFSPEEPRLPRQSEAQRPVIQKLRMPSGDFKEERLTTSAQATPSGTPSVTPCVTPSVTPSVTPCVTPQSSPAPTRRNWLQLSSATLSPTAEVSSPPASADMGGNEGGGGEKWSFFGSRSTVQKSPTDPGSETGTGFSLQSYFGLHKSSTVDGTNSQINLKVDDPVRFMPARMEIPEVETKRAPPRPHKLKPRDMNVLTPSGF